MKRALALLIAVSLLLTAFPGKSSASTSYTLTYYPPTSQGWVPGGSVTSSPAGISCGASGSPCTASFAAGTVVTLTATSNSGYAFDYFGSPCPGTAQATTCTITMNSNVNLDALWQYSSVGLDINITGNGSGTVTTSTGLSCSHSCSTTLNAPLYPTQTASITLTAQPASGSTFAGWQTSGSCANDAGRGGPITVNTSATCNMGYDGLSTNVYTVVPEFVSTAASGGVSSSTSTGSHANGQSPAGTANPGPANTITLPSTLGLTLWNGPNFGQSGQNLSPSNSNSTQVGIADKNDIPLALIDVNLSSKVDWSKATITYASSTTSHKAFVHGLTTAPGVVGGTFTLYVPYGNNDKYVGICPGASSLSVLSPSCPNLYYLSNGQNLSGKDTITASIVTVNNVKYWSISGLTGTGGFSSSTKYVDVAAATSTMVAPTKAKSSSGLYAVVVIIMLLAIGGSYKLWLPKLKAFRNSKSLGDGDKSQ